MERVSKVSTEPWASIHPLQRKLDESLLQKGWEVEGGVGMEGIGMGVGAMVGSCREQNKKLQRKLLLRSQPWPGNQKP